MLSLATLGFSEGNTAFYSEKLNTLQYLILNLLRNDPLGCYVEIKRLLREDKINISKEQNSQISELRKSYIEILNFLFTLLD